MILFSIIRRGSSIKDFRGRQNTVKKVLNYSEGKPLEWRILKTGGNHGDNDLPQSSYNDRG